MNSLKYEGKFLIPKTRLLTLTRTRKQKKKKRKIKVNGQKLETVTSFEYLGSISLQQKSNEQKEKQIRYI